jgi:raffinose/stachyose/melibiose transport system permease protein
VYEAADLDGVNAFQKFLHVEFPLIMTQVRINLVLLIIGTLQMYGFILILFGIEGGPNGKLMVPGLYMFRNAFTEGYAGYACAIGLILFVFILLLTEINNRFVRVEK